MSEVAEQLCNSISEMKLRPTRLHQCHLLVHIYCNSDTIYDCFIIIVNIYICKGLQIVWFHPSYPCNLCISKHRQIVVIHRRMQKCLGCTGSFTVSNSCWTVTKTDLSGKYMRVSHDHFNVKTPNNITLETYIGVLLFEINVSMFHVPWLCFNQDETHWWRIENMNSQIN